MKKCLLIAALAFGTLAVNAQSISLSTYAGTDITKYDGRTMNVSVNRYVVTGWNTISLPFAMSADKVNEVFGADCRLEQLVGVESAGTQIKLNFMDAKAEGIKANIPYILYYTGEDGTKRIVVEDATLTKKNASVTFWDINGVEVTFAAAQMMRDAKGVYGILARDNSEATFVNVSDMETSGFYATRCYIQLSNGTSTKLTTNHVANGETTSINSVLRGNEKADVYNLSGTKVATGLNAGLVAQLPAGVYVVKGKKIAVK